MQRCKDEFEIYCPVCARVIRADNVDKFESGDHGSLLFIHDNVLHDDSDIDALEAGIQ